jgi:Tfp pilus assembly protein PilO
LGAVDYYLWQVRAAVTLRHDEVWKRGVATLGVLVDRPRISADLARLQEALEVIDRNLVVEADMEVNLGYFFRLEKLCHVRLSQLNQLSSPPSPEGNPFKTIPISFRAAGTYAQLMNFLRQLETGPRILTVRTFSFSRADPKADAMFLDLSVDLLGGR